MSDCPPVDLTLVSRYYVTLTEQSVIHVILSRDYIRNNKIINPDKIHACRSGDCNSTQSQIKTVKYASCNA